MPGILALLLLLLSATPGAGQQSHRLEVGDTIWEVQLAAGEEYVGRVVAMADGVVTLETVRGTRIQFPREQAVRVQPARGTVRGGSFWPEDPNHSRLFFSPTARTLYEGDGYLGVYELFVPFVAYGISDRITLAGGSPFYLVLGGVSPPPVYLAPKVLVVSSDRFAASIGALGLIVPEDEDTYHLGIVYGVGTWGTSDHALSGGLGWGYVEDDIASKPLVMLGGETRVGRYTKLITENVFVPGETGVVVSGGIRFFGKRLSADAGLGALIGDDDSIWLPVVNFVYNFGPSR